MVHTWVQVSGSLWAALSTLGRVEKPERCAGAEALRSGVEYMSELLRCHGWKWSDILRDRSEEDVAREDDVEELILRVHEWATHPCAERVTLPSAIGCRKPMAWVKPGRSLMLWMIGWRQARISSAEDHARVSRRDCEVMYSALGGGTG